MVEDTGLDTFYLYTPFDAELRVAIKRLPADERTWDPERQAWTIDWKHYDTIQDAVWMAFQERLVEKK